MKQERVIIDGKTIIENVIIHHSAGNRCNGFSAEHVFNDFNSVGFNRGYKKYGYDFLTGYSPKYGQCEHIHGDRISYCEYHGCLYEFGKDDYAFVSFIDDPEMKDAGSTFNKEINRRSLAYVFAGDWGAENVPESMIEYFIKLFRPGAPLSWIVDKYPGVKFIGHRDTGDATACPGKYLYTYFGRINREIKDTRRIV